MNALYLIRQDNGQIALADFEAIINNLPDAKNLKKKDVLLDSAEADYFYENDRTIIRLDKNQQLIEVTGLGKASIRAVRELHPTPMKPEDIDPYFPIEQGQ
jgi:hypothetical protein